MSELTRRSFLKQSGAAAAAAGAFVAVPKGLTRSSTKSVRSDRPAPRTTQAGAKAKAKADRQLVVHVPDTRKNELRLMIGDREVVVHDRDLVARLTRATD
jgi:hypothetical protein